MEIPKYFYFRVRAINKGTSVEVEDASDVDVSEVVRCKDCKWWKTNYSWNGNEHKICVREAYEPLRNAEDFCSYGERREDGQVEHDT